MNEPRKEQILSIIIKEHIKTGAPVGSGVIVEKYGLDVSPATVRNDMIALENQGYIIQPHTSAGRVPTEKAYYHYLAGLKAASRPKETDNPAKDFLQDKSEPGLKQAAKRLAGKANLAVFWAFHRHNIYYTGLSNLFSQPEFSQVNVIYDISAVIDRIDEIINSIYDDYGFETKILIGEKNPFGGLFGTVMAKYKLGDNIGLFGVVGPMRLDYEENFRLVEAIRQKISA